MIKEEIVKPEAGFTLIEAILSLLVLGIMGAVVGFGFSIMAQVYINNTNMVTVTTKSEVAMERLRKEFLHIAAVNSATTTSSSITFTNAETPPSTHTVSYSGGVLSFDGFTLLDGIQTFSFTYYDDYTDTVGRTAWVDGTSRIIGIRLTMDQVGSATSVFNYETRVVPRNL
jgi:type II secretory pathway pseudopilin PulG